MTVFPSPNRVGNVCRTTASLIGHGVRIFHAMAVPNIPVRYSSNLTQKS